MYHLVTEWVTLPASFTCPALDQVLALLSTRNAPWNRLCFHVKLLEGVGGSLTPGPGPGGTRTCIGSARRTQHPSMVYGPDPVTRESVPAEPGGGRSCRATWPSPKREIARGGRGVKEIFVLPRGCNTDLGEGSAPSPPSRNVNTWKNSPGFTWKKFNGVNKHSRKSPLIQKAVGWQAEPRGLCLPRSILKTF